MSSRKHFEDRHLAVPPPADHPRPMGWSSLGRSRRRCLTFPVAAAGTAPPDPCRRCSWSAFALPCGGRSAGFHLRGLDRSAPTLAGATRPDRNAFGRVTHGRVLPRPPLRACHVDRELAQRRAPFSPRDCLPCVRQHAVESAPWPALARRLALRLAERSRARCVGPTSAISLLRTSTRASPVPGRSRAFARAFQGIACHHVRAIRFGGPHQGHSVDLGGRCLPVGACAAEPLASLSRLPREAAPLAREPLP